MYVTGIIKTAAFSAAIAAALLLSACSSGSGDEEATPELPPETSSTTAVEATATPEETPEPTEEAEAVVEETPTPELTPGPSVIDTSDSEQASAWQQTLATLGYPVTVDGDFGPGTEEATRQFQTDWDLPVSGVVDQNTVDVANFLISNLPEEEQAAPPPDGEAPPPEAIDNTENAEAQNARYEQAKADCTAQHGLLQAGPCVAEAMCFDVEPVSAATQCRRSYWEVWQAEPGAS